MDLKKLFRRKRYLINKRFQLMFIGRMQALTVAIIGVAYGANVIFFRNLVAKGMAAGLDERHLFFRFVEQQEAVMNRLFLLVTLAVLLVMFVGGVLLSHRVAGPLYRLNLHMREVATGKHKRPVSFRKGDYFPELAEAYNKQLELLVNGADGASERLDQEAERGRKPPKA